MHEQMSWARLAIAIVCGGVVSSLTDWLFMGDWLYKRYDRNPEIWRSFGGQGETSAILLSSIFPFLTCAVFAFLCESLHVYSYDATFGLALAIWLVGPLPLTITHTLFMKLSPAIATSYAIGWLVKLLVAALAVSLILAKARA